MGDADKINRAVVDALLRPPDAGADEGHRPGFFGSDQVILADENRRRMEFSADGSILTDAVIIGGGITGLSIAQELAERNFTVVVVEPEYVSKDDPFMSVSYTENPGIGGVARSQWSFVANKGFQEDQLQSPQPPHNMRQAERVRRRFGPLLLCVEEPEEKDAPCRLTPVGQDLDLERAVEPLIDALLDINESRILCKPYVGRGARSPDRARVTAEVSALFKRLWAERGGDPARLHLEPSDIEWIEKRAPDAAAGTIVLDLNVFALPGEHGFRFFPSFYRHVFDTMRRIPATVSVNELRHDGPTSDRIRRGRDTVFDNLVAVDSVGYVGDSEGPTAKIPRRKLRSAEEARAVLKDLLRETGYSGADLARLSLKVWQYMTSSRLRRETEYEDMSWYDFVEGDRFSARGRFLLDSTPGTLGGLFGSEADARTQGTVLLQCMRDQFSDRRESDMLLNGPTDEAWFAHWHRYLVSQGVGFVRGKLTGFEAKDGAVVPVVKVDARGGDGPDNVLRFAPKIHRGESTKLGRTVYYALALPLLAAHALADEFLDRAARVGVRSRDFLALLGFPKKSHEDLKRGLCEAYPTGPLRHLSGIQYFFNQELRFSGSHTMYLDAQSGLTAIAQPQYWLNPRDYVSGFRSVLSVDIAIWKRPRLGREGLWHAWGKSREEIAAEVWAQIERAHEGDYPKEWPKLTYPTAYHIDDNLVFESGSGGGLMDDRTPFLVNEKGRFRSRPGGVRDPQDRSRVRVEYEIVPSRVAGAGEVPNAHFVLAGTFMQTYTRINSMEAACESGRHAVNAILRDLKLPGDPCQVWDPEDCEDESMNPDKEIDERLCEKGMPHMGTILGVDRIDAWLPRDDG